MPFARQYKVEPDHVKRANEALKPGDFGQYTGIFRLCCQPAEIIRPTVARPDEPGIRRENSDLIGQTVSDHEKNRLRKATVGGSSPETLSAGIKRTAGSHPKERVSGELPRALAHSRNSQYLPGEILCQHSALSVAYPLLGWLPAARFIPCKGYATDKAWAGHERLESANPWDTRRTAPVKLSELLQIRLQNAPEAARQRNRVTRGPRGRDLIAGCNRVPGGGRGPNLRFPLRRRHAGRSMRPGSSE